MTQLVRKQIYILKRQEALLKKQARLRKVSEAELIREAIDQQTSRAAAMPFHPDPEAWERALAFMKSLQAQGALPNRRRNWTRAELYAERENRYGQRAH